MSKFFISCDEATTICDKGQYGKSKFGEKVKMLFHMTICKFCKCYSKQNSTMTKVYKEYAKSQCKKPKVLTYEEKEKMEETLKDKMLV